MNLELRHLRTLLSIAETASISRAAAALGYSQQTVSAQLQRIEQYFGRPVFERCAAGVRPTEYGASVLAESRCILTQVEAIGQGSPPRRVSRTLRLAATNTPILPGVLARLRRQRPDVQLTVNSVYATSDIISLLDRDELDAGFAVDYPNLEIPHSDSVVHREIATEPLFLALPSNHPQAQHTEVALGELADEAWFVTPDDGAGWPGVFYAACAAAGFVPGVVHEFLGDRRQLYEMIADGLGVSLVLATTRASPGVVIKSLAGTPVWSRLLLAWHQSGPAADVAEDIAGAAVATYGELIARAPHAQAWASRTFRLPPL